MTGLPLHGVRVNDPEDGQLELHWSDCNSLVCRGTGKFLVTELPSYEIRLILAENFETTWHRVFKLDETNRMLSITSANHQGRQQ